MSKKEKIAIIIGAGPAGLTAAYELITRTDYLPILLEETDMVGGISRTVNYKGNRMDIGGHRFFSKSDRVMEWWLSFLPLQELENTDSFTLRYQNKEMNWSGSQHGPDPKEVDEVMLVRNRLSRIFYLRKFFDYPIRLNGRTFGNLGIPRMIRIGLSYIRARLFPIRDEKNLEEFFINRFGRILYETFFRDYTEKVWGVPCKEIKPEWGAQRVKGLSVSKAIWHALRSIVPKENELGQKNVETSLIDRFLYPKLGPGQLWEEVCRQVIERGGQIHYNTKVLGLNRKDEKIIEVLSSMGSDGEQKAWAGDLFFSTMPVREMIKGMLPEPPKQIQEVAQGLIYRDFIAVGVLLTKMKHSDPKQTKAFVPDNWIYIQESDVLVGRIQVFNNWSPYMVDDPDKVWLGLEYFCNEGDALWDMDNDKILALAKSELEKIGLADASDFEDGVVVRMPKTYPAYFGSYDRFDEIIRYVNQFENLYLIGRNGMHKYNNQDHSMLTAMTAVDGIVSGELSRDKIWAVNTEEEYHEEK